MKLKNMKKEELELLSYTDLTELILKENKKSMNTPAIFKTICELLGLSDDEYADKIGDYYTSLTTDKRFLLLDSAEWDLKDKHKVEIVIEDDEDDEDEEPEVEEFEEVQEENIDDENTDDDLVDDDDMDELSIVTDEELEEE